MYACVFCQSHYCANDCQFLDSESEYTPMTAMTNGIAVTLAHALLSDPDGFTIRRDGIIPADGIYVGNPANVATYQRDQLTVEILAAWIETHGDSEYFGIWTHPDGTVYLDTPDRYSQSDVRAALVIASVRGEYSVWDMGNGREIRTPPRGSHEKSDIGAALNERLDLLSDAFKSLKFPEGGDADNDAPGITYN